MFQGLRAVQGVAAAEEFRSSAPAAGFFRYSTADVVQDPPGEIVRQGFGRYAFRAPDREVLVPGWLNDYVEAVTGGANAEGAESVKDESGRSSSV